MRKTFSAIIITSLTFFSFSFGQLPDLVVLNGEFSPAIANRGSPLTVAASVENVGTGHSAKSHLSFYLSPTTAISNGTLIGCVSVEPLAVGAISESKQIIVPVPSSISAGNYYVGWVVDPFNEVSESDENNGFYLPSTQLNVTNSIVYRQHIPYPIIFIHGLNSNDQTWNTMLSQLDRFGWSFGGRMDYCLNYDGNLSTALLANDLHDFTLQSALNAGDYYTVNFDVDPDGSAYNNTVESNLSAIVKQGKALRVMVKHVLDKTGADKVILAGHSMGGLASREYLQNAFNWQSDGRHHVAKLLTIGTPHGGSNQATFGLLDGYSEAVRDLRWSYSNDSAGVYLFGGNENNLASLGFNNMDVDCNGNVGDNVVGLNQKKLPVDPVYSCVIGTGGVSGDGIVDASRANLNNYYAIGADTFLVNAFHTDLPKQVITNLEGLDEPTYFDQSYSIGMDTLYYGLITTQSLANSFTEDYDDYVFSLASNSQLNITMTNISVPQSSIAVFDSMYNRKFIKYSNTFSTIDTTVLLDAGKYYLEIEAQPASYSWMFPYAFKLHSTPATSVKDRFAQTPDGILLLKNYPNPFNPSTNISFHLPMRSVVSLSIYDVLGREVANLVSGEQDAGEHVVHWDAAGLPGGVYFCRLRSGNFSLTRQLILIR